MALCVAVTRQVSGSDALPAGHLLLSVPDDDARAAGAQVAHAKATRSAIGTGAPTEEPKPKESPREGPRGV